MKEIIFYLNSISQDRLFKPIRERKDIISVLLESMRLMICGIKIPHEKSCGKIVLHIGETSRLIYISKEKYYSINFPFFIDYSDGCFIYNKNGVEIDSRIISKITELIFERNVFNSKSFSSFFDAFEDIYEEKDIWDCFFNLLTFEEGYIRFDNDIQHIELNHPQYHIDLFYEEHNKIKFGLNNNINDISFYKLLVNDDFYFLNKISHPDQEPPHA
jgi:hypothetical protein